MVEKRKTDEQRLAEVEAKISDLQAKAGTLRSRIRSKAEKIKAAKIARIARLLESRDDILQLDDEVLQSKLCELVKN